MNVIENIRLHLGTIRHDTEELCKIAPKTGYGSGTANRAKISLDAGFQYLQGCIDTLECFIEKESAKEDTPKPAPQGRKDTIDNRPDVY